VTSCAVEPARVAMPPMAAPMPAEIASSCTFSLVVARAARMPISGKKIATTALLLRKAERQAVTRVIAATSSRGLRSTRLRWNHLTTRSMTPVLKRALPTTIMHAVKTVAVLPNLTYASSKLSAPIATINERSTNRGDCDRNLLEDERDHRDHDDEEAENRLPFVHVLKSPLTGIGAVRSDADASDCSHMNWYSLYE
jgi:hypothetical protein